VVISPSPSVSAGPHASQREALRRVIADMERGQAGSGRPRLVATGFPAIDQSLPDGGLALGAVHEISGPMAHGFAARILSHLTGPVLWFRPQKETALLYAPTLQALGCRVGHWLVAYTPTQKDLLWGLEEGLRSGAVDAVVGEPQTPLGMTASRRLQLAAERGRALGLILTGPGDDDAITRLSPSALTSRWHISPQPTDPVADDAADDGAALWQVRLLKLRNAGTASWSVDATIPKGV
jgi:protein ImuA